MNRLLFGDNLKWLRDAKLFPDASVDLVYLDPRPTFPLVFQTAALCRDAATPDNSNTPGAFGHFAAPIASPVQCPPACRAKIREYPANLALLVT